MPATLHTRRVNVYNQRLLRRSRPQMIPPQHRGERDRTDVLLLSLVWFTLCPFTLDLMGQGWFLHWHLSEASPSELRFGLLLIFFFFFKHRSKSFYSPGQFLHWNSGILSLGVWSPEVNNIRKGRMLLM